MPNSECLEGFRCPKCGSYEPFEIEVKTTVRGDFLCYKSTDMREFICMGCNCHKPLAGHAFPDIQSAYVYIHKEAIHA